MGSIDQILERAMFKILILASGEGSNAMNLIQYYQSSDRVNIEMLISDRKQAPVLVKAEKENINATYLSYDDEFYSKLLQVVIDKKIDYIILAGFMRIIPQSFLNEFSQIINIHPSFLPAYPGLNAYERCFKSSDSSGGVTIHWVDEGVDTGKIILQEKLEKKEAETLEGFILRGKKLEHKLYPKALDMVFYASKN